MKEISNKPADLYSQSATVNVGPLGSGWKISPDLIGVFFEDISYAADGGLYAELLQNRSFEYSQSDLRNGSAMSFGEWNALTGWEFVERDGGKGTFLIDTGNPVHLNNPHYAVLGITPSGGSVGLCNKGFDGIPIQSGETYDFSVFARQLAWPEGPLTVRLEDEDGSLLGEAVLPVLTPSWKKYTAEIKAMASTEQGRLLLLASHPGRIALDMISLFPRKTFRNRPNGLRADLAQAIADLKPKFMRFPGGCLVHGDGMDNLYDWKNTIGPVESRKSQRNIWGYHQTLGLGYFEYFQFCEDIGAKPLPVVPAGVSCQNSGGSVTGMGGKGQLGIPMEEMPGYIQDVLDLIEYANGPADSEWGSKRAAAGHPAPFNLEYLGVGNEEHMTPVFKERFKMIYEAVKKAHPEITVVGTAGPFHSGEDYVKGWDIADELKVPVIDEHYYEKPEWFWDNLNRYDSYDRRKSKVYVGEYAAHDIERRNTLRSAIAEAAYLTGLERNGDVIQFASYAPLLARKGHTNWNPNLIYFAKTEVFPAINYHVQKLFSMNSGDTCFPVSASSAEDAPDLAVSAVSDSSTGDMIIKIVNGAGAVRKISVEISGIGKFSGKAMKTVLAGDDPLVVNDHESKTKILPQASSISIGSSFVYDAPAYSLTIFRMENPG
ncbi:MAG TPA: alpha-N-arabinofuranosidase [Lentisphaeria bacterium]|nr:MAG: alpha-N-arabinofuranosidase [Lentisphaerae bacterium GWF2_50_93]HCE45179.1 alpha-N-arabinofuranosidase [Lentisphaeria bacterium]